MSIEITELVVSGCVIDMLHLDMLIVRHADEVEYERRSAKQHCILIYCLIVAW